MSLCVYGVASPYASGYRYASTPSGTPGDDPSPTPTPGTTATNPPSNTDTPAPPKPRRPALQPSRPFTWPVPSASPTRPLAYIAFRYRNKPAWFAGRLTGAAFPVPRAPASVAPSPGERGERGPPGLGSAKPKSNTTTTTASTKNPVSRLRSTRPRAHTDANDAPMLWPFVTAVSGRPAPPLPDALVVGIGEEEYARLRAAEERLFWPTYYLTLDALQSGSLPRTTDGPLLVAGDTLRGEQMRAASDAAHRAIRRAEGARGDDVEIVAGREVVLRRQEEIDEVVDCGLWEGDFVEALTWFMTIETEREQKRNGKPAKHVTFEF